MIIIVSFEFKIILLEGAVINMLDASPPFQVFLNTLKENGRSENTLRAYQFDWQHFLAWYEAVNEEDFDLVRLTMLDVQDYVNWSSQQGFKANTINRRLGLIKHFLSWTEENNLSSKELRQRVRKIRIIPKQNLAPKSLDTTEVRRLLRELERTGTIRDCAIIYLLLYTGLRVGELVQLKLGDVLIGKRKGSIHIGSNIAKGNKERIVPVPNKARQMLQDYLNSRAIVALDELIFIGRQGPISTAGVAAMLKKYAKRVDINKLTPHILRHTFAYSYLEHNANDLVGLADILGHSDLNTTRIYTQPRLEDLQQGVELVEFY